MEKHTHQFLFPQTHGICEQRLAFQQATPEAPKPEPQTAEKISDSPKKPESINAPKDAADQAKSAQQKIEEDMGGRKQEIEDAQQNVKRLEEQLRNVEGIEGKDSTTAAELRDQIASQQQEMKTLKPPERKPETDAVETGGGVVGDVTEETATGGLENPNKAGEKPKANAPEVKETGNTHLDRLMGNFDSAVKEHDAAEVKAAKVRQGLKNNPKDPELQKELQRHEMEKVKAVMKAFATFFEGLKRLFNGTLFTEVKSDVKGGESGAQNPTEGVAGRPAAVTPEQLVQNELAKNNPKNAQETHAALGGIRENADKKIQENTKSIESLDKRIDGVKKENDVLIGKKGEVEKELNALRGEEGKENQVFELQTELDRLNTLIQANQKAIDTLDARRDALKKENIELTAKKEAAEKIDENITKGMEKLFPMMQKLAEMLGLKLQDLNVGYNGQPIIVINNINGNNNTVTNTLNTMGAKINPETKTAEISAEQVLQSIGLSKDASAGQIREDKDGNYWQKTEKGWVSHNDAAKKINSDSGYRGVTWFDSQMDENTKRIVENPESTTPAVRAQGEEIVNLGMDGDAVSPDGTYRRENPASATPESVAENIEKDLQGWLKDIQERMDRNGYDVVVALSDDKTSFVLRSRSVTEDPVKNLKTVKGFAEKRGMDPQTNADGAVSVRIEKFVSAETAKPSELTGYLGPKYGLEKLDTATIAELNQKMFSARQNIA